VNWNYFRISFLLFNWDFFLRLVFIWCNFSWTRLSQRACFVSIDVSWVGTSAPSKPAYCASSAHTDFKMTTWTAWHTRWCTRSAATVYSTAALSKVIQHPFHTLSSFLHLLFDLMENICFDIWFVNWNAWYWVSMRTAVSMGAATSAVFVKVATRSLQYDFGSYVECLGCMVAARSYATNVTVSSILRNSRWASWWPATLGTTLTQWAAVTQMTYHRLNKI
jgi:hypothetical protein